MEKKGKKWTRASKDCIKLNKEIETELDIYESKNLKDKEADGDNYKAPFPNNIDTMANLDFYYCYKFYVCDQYYDLLKDKQFLPEYDWPYVVKVAWRTFDDYRCPICLDGFYEMKSPHITFCGHVFCLGCIVRHLKMELKTSKLCPLCKETIILDQLKTVEVSVAPRTEKKNKIQFYLMKRDQLTNAMAPAYQSKDEESSKKFEKVSKMTKEEFEYINKTEISSLLIASQEFCSPENAVTLKNSINVATEFLISKMKKSFDNKFLKKHFYNYLHRKSICPEEQKKILNKKKKRKKKRMEENANRPKRKKSSFDMIDKDTIYNFEKFYQETSMSQTFLHPINLKYMLLQENYPPSELTGEIINHFVKIQSNRVRNKYRFAAYLPNGTEFRLVVIKMDDLLSPELFKKYLNEMRNYKHNLKIREQRETKKVKRMIMRAKEKKEKEMLAEFPAFDFQNFEIIEQETDETFKVNKNDPTKYPELKKIEVEGMNEITNPILRQEMERLEKIKQEKIMKRLGVMGEEEEEGEKEPEEGGIIIVKKKKKRGKGRKRRGRGKGKKTVLGDPEAN